MKHILPAVLALCLFGAAAAPAAERPHNVVIFVADGLRYDSVTAETAPALYAAKTAGVDFTNSHSLYPTITTVNASAIATGHYIGDTGNFGNVLYVGRQDFGKSATPFIEDNEVLGQLNAAFGGNYLNEMSLLAAAREKGFATAAIGKAGPTAIQDITARDGTTTIVIDDSLGKPQGLPLPANIAKAITAAGLPLSAPKTSVPNIAQNAYMLAIATKAVLPKLKASNKPFVLVFWSRDPDASQHATKDSVGSISPGINGPTGKAAIRNADTTFAGIMAALKEQGLADTTNVFITADHGFSTIGKTVDSRSSKAAEYDWNANGDKNAAHGPVDLRNGFVAIDLAADYGLPLFDPNLKRNVDYRAGHRPSYGNGFIGKDPKAPEVIVAANGGSDLIYLPTRNAPKHVRRIVDFLTRQPYVSGIFVDDKFGKIPGALPMSAINYRGTAKTPQPAILFSFASSLAPDCEPALLCAVEFADTSLKTGQGMHGSFSRADTRNFMAATGPDFRAATQNPTPVSNADIVPTFAHLLGLSIPAKGALTGRVLTEALTDGAPAPFERKRRQSAPAANGQTTVLDWQTAGGRAYFDAAGFPGRTVGLSTP